MLAMRGTGDRHLGTTETLSMIVPEMSGDILAELRAAVPATGMASHRLLLWSGTRCSPGVSAGAAAASV